MICAAESSSELSAAHSNWIKISNNYFKSEIHAGERPHITPKAYHAKSEDFAYHAPERAHITKKNGITKIVIP